MLTIARFVSSLAVAAALTAAASSHSQAQVGVPSWTGFYVGGHLGGAGVRWRTDVSFVASNPTTGAVNSATFPGPSGSNTSFVGGGQVGYNWQMGSYLLGLEGTATWLGHSRNEAFNISSAAMIAAGLAAITPSGGSTVDGFASNWSREVEWLATARARLGYLINPNAFLYLTGGLAVGEVQSSVSYTGLRDQGGGGPVLVAISAHNKSTQVGFVIGGGGEAAVTRNISIRAEYLYVDLGDTKNSLGTYLISPCCIQTASANERVTIQTGLIGLNFRY